MTVWGAASVLAGFAAMTAIVMLGMAALMMALRIKPGTTPPPPTAFLAGNVVVGLVAALVGGALAARLAPFAPFDHVLALAGLVLAMSIVCAISYGDRQPRWYQAVLGIGAPLAVATGGFVAQSFA